VPSPAPVSVIEARRLTDAERRGKGVLPLPATLAEALDCLDEDRKVVMSGDIKAPYLMHKRAEIAEVAAIEIDELCALYAKAY
jgi:glutamine synthetase